MKWKKELNGLNGLTEEKMFVLIQAMAMQQCNQWIVTLFALIPTAISLVISHMLWSRLKLKFSPVLSSEMPSWIALVLVLAQATWGLLSAGNPAVFHSRPKQLYVYI